MAITADNPILHLKDYGQSVWMDNLSRDLLQSGELAQLIESRDVHGITSNPAIFEKAIAGNAIYDADIEAGIRAGKSVEEIYESLVFEDIRNACDVLMPIYQESGGVDGYVSLEVPPNLAHDTDGTLREARRYYNAIQRPNLMIKIPGTPEGLPAVEAAISEGINVNVTLLFSVQSYIDTAWAYIRGLEARAAKGQDVRNLASVASFFLSRIDSKVDDRLDALAAEADDCRSHRPTASSERQGGDRQRQAGLPGIQADYCGRSLAGPSGKRSPGAASTVGQHQYQKSRLQRCDVCRRANRPRHRQYPAPQHHRSLRRPLRCSQPHRNRCGVCPAVDRHPARPGPRPRPGDG
jgi:transaldolase